MPKDVQTKPLLRWLGERLRHRLGSRALFVLNAYLPYVAAGIRIRQIAQDTTWIQVAMPLRRTNQNYFGTHFGGSLYAMCDPFFALILTENLGRDYVVWDKAATIRFRRPGLGTVSARFEVPRRRIDDIRAAVDEHGKCDSTFTTQVLDARGDIVAEVEKVVAVRRA